jgi:hypothetical protein
MRQRRACAAILRKGGAFDCKGHSSRREMAPDEPYFSAVQRQAAPNYMMGCGKGMVPERKIRLHQHFIFKHSSHTLYPI